AKEAAAPWSSWPWQSLRLARMKWEADMRKVFVVAAIAALVSPAAIAHVVRHDSIPEAFQGTWAPGKADCKDQKSVIVLEAKAYVGRAGNCAVEAVSETPGPKGAIFSARLQCPGAAGQAKKTANLIFKSGSADQILMGPTFERLVEHRRCAAGSAAA